MKPPSEPISKTLTRLLGVWTTEATHPAMPGVIVHGTAEVEWLEGRQFLIHRARSDKPEFPDSISIIGHMDRGRADDGAPASPAGAGDEQPLSMHYFDSRGVFRVYQASMDANTWKLWRDDPGFSQRFVGTLTDGGDTILGQWQLRRDADWADDLAIIYRRRSSS